MKILHVTKKYPNAYGGDVVVVSNLEKYQRRAGDEVYILTSNCDAIIDAPYVTKFGLKDEWANLDAITIKRIISLPSLISKTITLMRKNRPDVIHSHSPDMGFVVSLIARIYKVPMVHTCHGIGFAEPHYSSLKKRLELFFLKYSGFKHVIALSHRSVSLLSENGVKGAVFLPNGVDLGFWKPQGLIKKNNVPTFLAIGRLEDQKGFNYLLESVAKLKEKNHDFKVIIAGDGSKRDSLRQYSTELDINDFVEFAGARNKEELRKLYALSHIFVISSIWEGFPLTILEAWAMGLPIIATDVGDIKDIAKNNATIIKPESVPALTESMETLLLHPERMRNDNSNFVRRYDWNDIVQKLKALYE